MLPDTLEPISRLLQQAGMVFVAILVLSTFMWSLIIERYWYFYLVFPNHLQHHVKYWKTHRGYNTPSRQRIRQEIIAALSLDLRHRLQLIQTFTAVLPMLGLLGTVIGMVTSFETMASFGAGNVRGFAAGVSQALLTTTAGLVTSLSGLYFSVHLLHRAKYETERARNLLNDG